MYVLLETAAGYAIFRLLREKFTGVDADLFAQFESADKLSQVIAFDKLHKHADTEEATAAAVASIEGSLTKKLKKLLKKLHQKEMHEKLVVEDAKLGGVIKDKVGIECVAGSAFVELFRCLRQQQENLIGAECDATAMALGLAHSLSRYKLKFSPDKIDIMIVQAVSLLEDIDKELNQYTMRAREWYGWHFPELGKIISDHLAYAKTMLLIGDKKNTPDVDLSSVLPEELEAAVKRAALNSIGTDVHPSDIEKMAHMCQQVVELTAYRAELYDYIKNRTRAIAPNLSALLGEHMAARLVAHTGFLTNLAKLPASTVQILGAEKALFRALKKKHDTPKYGLLYHATLIGQAHTKVKGKMSRMLASKVSLAARVDALRDEEFEDGTLGIQYRATLERRLKSLETGQLQRISGTGKFHALAKRYQAPQGEIYKYDDAADSTIKPGTKHKLVEETTPTTGERKPKQPKLELSETALPDTNGISPTADDSALSEKAKRKKAKQERRQAEADAAAAAAADGQHEAKPSPTSNVDSSVDEGLADGSAKKKKKKSKKIDQ